MNFNSSRAELCSLGAVKLNTKTATVLRTAKEATNYVQLEQAIPFAQLHETINQIVDDYDRATECSRERKRIRSWTAQGEEQLRRDWRNGRCVGELADQFDRDPKSVEHRLVVMGELNRGAIRRMNPAAARDHATGSDGEVKKAA